MSSESTIAEELAKKIEEIQKEISHYQDGAESVRNYYIKSPFFKTVRTTIGWVSHTEKELSHDMQKAFYDFLKERIVTLEQEIKDIRVKLAKVK